MPAIQASPPSGPNRPKLYQREAVIRPLAEVDRLSCLQVDRAAPKAEKTVIEPDRRSDRPYLSTVGDRRGPRHRVRARAH
jgi:hypothetical protein